MLTHSRKVAKKESIEEFEMAEETLKASEFWNANCGSKLIEWYENTWLQEKGGWQLCLSLTDTIFFINLYL